MRLLILSLFILGMYILQASFFTHLAVYGARPDLITATVVAVGITAGPFEGMVSGILGGFILDLLRGTFIGLSVPGKLLVGLMAGFIPKRVYVDSWWVPAVSAFVATLLDQSFFLILGNSFGLDQPLWPSFRRLIIASGIYTATMAPLVIRGIRHLYGEFLNRGWFKEQRLL
ncbi:MAG: rod shape-determining protein MreD [Firmicutes bacterium]|nr:rod shape-determining protein MreD [Bacillota bacterium]